MKEKMSAEGGSAFGGKKILFMVGAVALLAAACNSQQSYSKPPGYSNGTVESQTGQSNQPSNGITSQSSVDGTISQLNASVDSEQTINSTSDSDVVNSDSTAVDGYTGVSNATY